MVDLSHDLPVGATGLSETSQTETRMSDVTRQVTLVTTLERAKSDFGAEVTMIANSDGVVSCPYTLSISEKQDPFAAWLLEHVSTTRRSEEASRIMITLPENDAQYRIRQLARIAERLAFTSSDEALKVLEAGAATLRAEWALSSEYWPETNLITVQYLWPVYGSSTTSSCKTPEEYWLHCASQIRATDGVPVRVGSEGAVLPESLIRTFANGSGLELHERYHREADAYRVGKECVLFKQRTS